MINLQPILEIVGSVEAEKEMKEMEAEEKAMRDNHQEPKI